MLSHFLRTKRVSGTLSLVGSINGSTSSSASLSVTYPTGITAGDLIVVFFDAGDANTATPSAITTPTGYTLLFTQGGYNTSAADADNFGFYYKIAAGTESGTFTMTGAIGTYRTMCVAVFRKSTGPVTSVTRLGTTQQGSTGVSITPTTQTITNSTGTPPLIAIAGYEGSSAQSFSPAGTSLVTGGKGMIYRIDNTLTTDTTVSLTANSTEQIMASFYLQVT